MTAGTDSSAADGSGGRGDDETRTFITQTYQRAEVFLFGRRTYELFAGSWGSIDQMRAHPIGVALNEAPKYVASASRV